MLRIKASHRAGELASIDQLLLRKRDRLIPLLMRPRPVRLSVLYHVFKYTYVAYVSDRMRHV